MAFHLSSTAFTEGGDIPRKHTCDGQDVSPPLEWTEPTDSTRGFALICDDPDAPAGTWVHWVAYDIAAGVRSLPEAVKDGVRHGMNDFHRSGYGGPCPPPGPPHRYYFKLYALARTPDLKPGATKKELLKAIEGQILAEAHLMGRYQRKR